MRVHDTIEDALEWRNVRLAGEAAAGLQVAGVFMLWRMVNSIREDD